MARILVLSKGAGSATSVADLLPALELLTHEAHVAAADAQALTLSGRFDVIILDARRDLAVARQMCRLFGASGNQVPLLLVLTEGGFATVTPEWGASDLIWEDAPPAELEWDYFVTPADIIDAVHTRIVPLAGHTPQAGPGSEGTLEESRLGL